MSVVSEPVDYLSFRLPDSFIDRYASRAIEWGFPMGAGNTFGEIQFVTKYSRKKVDGTKERWHECCRRVIEGMYSILKDHCLAKGTPWRDDKAQRSAQEAYDRLFTFKWTPPGRGLWMMGTEFVNGRRDSGALQNCGFISTAGLDEDAIKPFVMLMEMSMLGVGVGFDTRGAGKVWLHEPSPRTVEHVVGDSREGWCHSVRLVLESYFYPDQPTPVFDYSKVRPAGEPIKGFGGVAAGPEPLEKLHERLRRLLGKRGGEQITSTDIVDIMNMVGKCVVAANVRSSAEIALGDPHDEDFLDLKNWNINPERMAQDGWGYTSNNSVIAEVGGNYDHLASRIALNGEPGLIWLDMCRKYGRLADPPTDADWRVMGVNPCGEQPLEDKELCTLVETYPTKCDDLDDYIRTLKFAFMYAKAVTLLPTHWGEVNEVMGRNHRIGTSMSGLAMFVEEHGWSELRRWQDAGYAELRRRDHQYSEWLGVRESIKVSTIKPAGTTSLLVGVTPGAHWPTESGWYLRRMRENVNNPIVRELANAGYHVEANVSNPDYGVVITCPVVGPRIRPERGVSVWEKVALAASCQEWWSDNSVSLTATFQPHEEHEIGAVLRAFDGKLKSISFLPLGDEGAYPQMPYEMVSTERWNEEMDKVVPLNWEAIYRDSFEAEGEAYCTTDVCEIRTQ